MKRTKSKATAIIKCIICSVLVLSLSAASCTFAFAETQYKGDVNSDSRINMKDVLFMRKHIAGHNVTIDKAAADINNDGAINMKDVLLLRKGIAGIIDLDDYKVVLPDDALGSNLKTPGDKINSPISGEEYRLVFIDDFEGDKLNSKNWTVYTKNYNQAEESVNRRENVTVDDGILNLWAKREDKVYTGDADSWNTPKVSNLTSGAINSQGKQAFKYGRLEIKCKIPYSYGMWAAFWTMGEKQGWPWCGETDIMEFVGGTAWGHNRDGEYLSNLHWCDPNLSSNYAWSTSTDVGATDTDEGDLPSKSKLSCGYTYQPENINKLNDEWHICGVEWTEKYMTFYCDDVAYFTVDITRSSMRQAFHQPHYMILNIVMGGSWAGTPDEDSVFPQTLSVDWVKVWQK